MTNGARSSKGRQGQPWRPFIFAAALKGLKPLIEAQSAVLDLPRDLI
jgi:hypothetical protein